MFDVSFFELLLIGLVALLVLGPNKLLEMARFGGYWLGRVRKQFSTVKEEIDREIRMDELRRRLADEERALKADLNPESSSVAPLADAPASSAEAPARTAEAPNVVDRTP